MWPNQQFLADLVTFTEEILNGKLNFLCSVTTNTNKIVEKETLLVNSDEIAKTFKRHFTETAEKLNTFEWPSNTENLTEETLTKYCVKSVRIRSYSGPYFPAVWLNTHQNNSEYYAAKIIKKLSSYSSIAKVKHKYLIQETFSKPVSVKNVENIIKNIQEVIYLFKCLSSLGLLTKF